MELISVLILCSSVYNQMKDSIVGFTGRGRSSKNSGTYVVLYHKEIHGISTFLFRKGHIKCPENCFKFELPLMNQQTALVTRDEWNLLVASCRPNANIMNTFVSFDLFKPLVPGNMLTIILTPTKFEAFDLRLMDGDGDDALLYLQERFSEQKTLLVDTYLKSNWNGWAKLTNSSTYTVGRASNTTILITETHFTIYADLKEICILNHRKLPVKIVKLKFGGYQRIGSIRIH